MADLPHPLPAPLAELISIRFRALAEPTRIRILDALRDGPASVQELAAVVGTTPQNVSRHLATLVDAGILSRSRSGTAIIHAVRDPSVYEMCEQVCGSVHDRFAALAELTGPATPTHHPAHREA